MKFAMNLSILLIVVGALLWLSNAGYLSVKRDWPIALVVVGADLFVVTLVGLIRRRSRETKKKEDVQI
ncbi:hypothetical protein JXL83_01880 [candidate division WOR-3 bacterium]|nr:hypothetical protein [candidate division WOR-3 bacterium]